MSIKKELEKMKKLQERAQRFYYSDTFQYSKGENAVKQDTKLNEYVRKANLQREKVKLMIVQEKTRTEEQLREVSKDWEGVR